MEDCSAAVLERLAVLCELHPSQSLFSEDRAALIMIRIPCLAEGQRSLFGLASEALPAPSRDLKGFENASTVKSWETSWDSIAR